MLTQQNYSQKTDFSKIANVIVKAGDINTVLKEINTKIIRNHPEEFPECRQASNHIYIYKFPGKFYDSQYEAVKSIVERVMDEVDHVDRIFKSYIEDTETDGDTEKNRMKRIILNVREYLDELENVIF
ncbi:MAG: hypothetical protein K9J21_11920 [Bacteroidales bacterium]|nr:hypothetical protein [Bacteroidales bacterium]